MRPASLLLCLFAAASPLSASVEEAYTFRHPSMGTVWTIRLYAESEEAGKKASDAAFARISELDAILSDYIPGSPLNKLSATAGTGQTATVTGDLLTVLLMSRQAAAESGGIFDITIGPCVQLWRSARKTKTLPSAAELAAAREATGWEALVIDETKGTALLKKPGMKLDTGGIAKGYAQDEAMKVLREKFHITSALIDAGGSPLVSGRPPGRDGWNIQIAKTAENDPDTIVRLENACVDTSGNLHQFVEIDGRRYSHIIDIKTGLGMLEPTQATVVKPRAAEADWLATALCVMGPEKGMEYIRKHHPGTPARIVQRETDGSVTLKETESFAALVVKPK